MRCGSNLVLNEIMKRILLTGLSGTGKSTIISKLAAHGYKAMDLDGDEYSHWVPVTAATINMPVKADRDWAWREDRVQNLLSTEDADTLFVSGCAENMSRFIPQFDHVILLTTPLEKIVNRLETRTNNSYGKKPEELIRVLGQVLTVEPLLREVATGEIDTSGDVKDVLDAVLRMVKV